MAIVLLSLIFISLAFIAFILAGGQSLFLLDTDPYNTQRLDGRLPQTITTSDYNFTPHSIESNTQGVVPSVIAARTAAYSADTTTELHILVAECSNVRECSNTLMGQIPDGSYSEIKVGKKPVKRLSQGNFNMLAWTDKNFFFFVSYNGDITLALDAALATIEHKFSSNPLIITPRRIPGIEPITTGITNKDGTLFNPTYNYSEIDERTPSIFFASAPYTLTKTTNPPYSYVTSYGRTLKAGRYYIFSTSAQDDTLLAWVVACEDVQACHSNYLSEVRGHGSTVTNIEMNGKTVEKAVSSNGNSLLLMWTNGEYFYHVLHDNYVSEEPAISAVQAFMDLER